jgi:hypothetical protein
MNKPQFITFTGVDSNTDLAACSQLAKEFPVEFGFLMSETRQDRRYSGIPYVQALGVTGVRIALHFCGSIARKTIAAKTYRYIPECVSRIQINLPTAEYSLDSLAALGSERVTIYQARNTKVWESCPNGVYPLLDLSGGLGEEIKEWPQQTPETLVGYAGGLNARNVKKFIDQLPPHKFWIDMESGVRTDDWFDINKCRQVCLEIFG